jgi:hypothetical protein
MDKLKAIMNTMIERAQGEPCKPIVTDLGHGLRIHLIYQDDALKLYLSRIGVYPSNQEWITVLQSIGYQSSLFAQGKKEGRFYLYGNLPVQEKLAL